MRGQTCGTDVCDCLLIACVVSENLHCKYLAAFDEAQAAVNSQCIDEMERCRVSCLVFDLPYCHKLFSSTILFKLSNFIKHRVHTEILLSCHDCMQYLLEV